MLDTNFEFIESLGAGATAEVFRAKNLKDDRIVAIKRIHNQLLLEEDSRTRVHAEAKVLASLNHPNIVSLYNVYDGEGQFAFEIELVDGADLRRWMKSYQLPLIEPKLWILVQIARGLGGAHEREILHRDLKPENILISKQGEVKITDFGLARSITQTTITKIGLLVGSLAYMAPEVINYDRPTQQSDIFSFGVLAYELLTGASPFPGQSPQALIKHISTGEFIPMLEVSPSVPVRIAELIESCLSQNPEHRPESIWQVEAEIMGELSSRGLMASCQKLCSQSEAAQVLPEVYKRKHSLLKKEIQACLELGTKESRQKLISLISEMQILFPEDSFPAEALCAISNTDKPDNKKKKAYLTIALIGFLVVAILSGTVFFALNSDPKEAQQVQEEEIIKEQIPEEIPIEPQPVKAAEPVVAQPRKRIQPRVSPPPPPPPKTGYLSVQVPEGVDVYIGETLVPQEQWQRYELPTGKHTLKMVREGYLPIESIIEIKGNQTTSIRAGSND